MQKFLDQFSRFFVGALFIFSGLIKLNDPVGTEIKMEEYFEVFTQDFGSVFHYFIPWSLEIGMIMIVLEVALGVAILLLYRMEITTWVLLLLMIFFTFLTFYSAYFDKVTDCAASAMPSSSPPGNHLPKRCSVDGFCVAPLLVQEKISGRFEDDGRTFCYWIDRGALHLCRHLRNRSSSVYRFQSVQGRKQHTV